MYNNIFAAIYTLYKKNDIPYVRALCVTALAQMFPILLVLILISKLLAKPLTFFISEYKFINGLGVMVWITLLGVYYNKKRVAIALEKILSKSSTNRIKWRVIAALLIILPLVYITVFPVQHK